MRYVKNAWYAAGFSKDLANASLTPIKILGERIVLFRTIEGNLFALEDRCVHRLAPLSLGRCEGDKIRCMYHGILYDANGAIHSIPGQDSIPPGAKLRSYPVAERHGWIWIWMGNTENAADNLIPNLIGLDHPDYILGSGNLDYAAAAYLITENLLDFSHIAYVHESSFKLGTQMADAHAKITSIDRGIRYVRWMENLTTTSTGEVGEPLDSYMTYDYLIPGVLMLSIASFALGTAKNLYYGTPDFLDASRDVSFSGQAVTPMDENSTRYFFTYGTHTKFGTEEMLDPMMAMVGKAFQEDKIMIEAQQKVLQETPDSKVIPTAHDRSITMYSKMVEKLAASENA